MTSFWISQSSRYILHVIRIPSIPEELLVSTSHASLCLNVLISEGWRMAAQTPRVVTGRIKLIHSSTQHLKQCLPRTCFFLIFTWQSLLLSLALLETLTYTADKLCFPVRNMLISPLVCRVKRCLSYSFPFKAHSITIDVSRCQISKVINKSGDFSNGLWSTTLRST